MTVAHVSSSSNSRQASGLREERTGAMQRLERIAFGPSRAFNWESGVLASKFKSQQELQENTKSLPTKGSSLVVDHRETTEPTDGFPGKQPPKQR